MKFKQTVSILGIEEKTGEKNGKIWRLVIVHLLTDEFVVIDAIVAKIISEGPKMVELSQIHNEQYDVELRIVPKGRFDIALELVDF